MMKIFHNPRCKKSREGLQYLMGKYDKVEIREYLKIPLTNSELQEIILKSGIKPDALIRTQEEYFRKNLKGLKFSDSEWMQIIIENPVLLKRPIVVSATRAVHADPPKEIDRLL